MLPFWSTPSPYQPIAQDEKISESGSASDLLEQRKAGQTSSGREKWLGKVVLCIAVANVLVAIATVIATRDISKLHIPLAGVDISALPRPDPYVGLNICMSSFASRVSHSSRSTKNDNSVPLECHSLLWCYIMTQFFRNIRTPSSEGFYRSRRMPVASFNLSTIK
jgi:hypothetical protein